MISKKREFKVATISKGLGLNNLYIIVLKEKGGRQLFPLLINAEQKITFFALINNTSFSSLSLLKTIQNIFFDSGLILEECTLCELVSEGYNARLLLNRDGVMIETKTDAVTGMLFALYFRSPIYIEDQLLEGLTDEGNGELFSIPIKTLSNELLKEALDDAVQNEQYDIASILRDEINRRK